MPSNSSEFERLALRIQIGILTLQYYKEYVKSDQGQDIADELGDDTSLFRAVEDQLCRPNTEGIHHMQP